LARANAEVVRTGIMQTNCVAMECCTARYHVFYFPGATPPNAGGNEHANRLFGETLFRDVERVRHPNSKLPREGVSRKVLDAPMPGGASVRGKY